MDTFKTFLEDLASGRPAKKPVSSNLLKQRARENKKALDTGFMKMPDYVKKKFNEEEEYKPHMMYKGKKKVMAKKKEDHDRLNKQGYDHDNPETEKIEELNKSTLANYKGKAEKDLKVQRDKYFRPQEDPSRKEARRKAENRIKGMKMADKKMVEEKKNCGCGQDPCITYGKGGKKEMKEQNIFEISDALKKRYMAKAGKEVSDKEHMKDYLQRQMNRSNEKTPGTFSGMNKKFVDDKVDRETAKRRKGMRIARSKLVNSVEFLDLDTVLVEKSTPTNPSLWSKAKAAARSKFDVYPSAYANGWAVQWYKKRGGGWKKGVKEEINLAELSPATISSYQKKAGKQYTDLKKSTMSATSREGGYHKGYISQKEYDAQHDMADKKARRGKGLAMSKGKGVQKENYEKGRGPTGIAFAIQKGHPDAENPKTRKKYPERQTPEYKANWNKKNKTSMTNPPVRSEGAMKRLATDEAERKRLSAKKSMEKRVPRRMYDKPAYERDPDHYKKQKSDNSRDKYGRSNKMYFHPSEEHIQLVTNLNLDEAVAAMVKRGLGRVKDTLQQAGQQYKDHQAKQMKAGKGIYQNPVSGENIARRRAQMQKKRLMK